MFVIDSQTECYWNNNANEFSASMSLIPVLPLFLELNRKFFQNSLFEKGVPKVSVRWSDNRMRTTAGIYRSKTNCFGVKASEIILSRPVLENLPQKALTSTLCHEMIHAWIDLDLKVEEAHGPNFHKRMAEINSAQIDFQVTVRHSFPISKRIPKWVATCPSCKKVLVMDVLLKVLPVAVVAIIILEVDGIKNAYLNFNLFLEVHE